MVLHPDKKLLSHIFSAKLGVWLVWLKRATATDNKKEKKAEQEKKKERQSRGLVVLAREENGLEILGDRFIAGSESWSFIWKR